MLFKLHKYCNVKLKIYFKYFNNLNKFKLIANYKPHQQKSNFKILIYKV